MRKVILNVAVSLDGYIEDAHGAFDWCFTDQDYGMTNFLENTDAVFYGRKSYELFLKMGQAFDPSKKHYIFSKSLKTTVQNTIVIRDNLEAFIQKIKSEPGKNIWLFGGADLIHHFLVAGWIDEMWLAVHPILLGGGKPLFQDFKDRIYFNLKETRTYDSGLIQLFYQKKNK